MISHLMEKIRCTHRKIPEGLNRCIPVFPPVTIEGYQHHHDRTRDTRLVLLVQVMYIIMCRNNRNKALSDDVIDFDNAFAGLTAS